MSPTNVARSRQIGLPSICLLPPLFEESCGESCRRCWREQIDPFQLDFKSTFGTEAALIMLIDDHCQDWNRDNRSFSSCLALDWDIDCGNLLSLLQGLGIGGTVLQQFSFLLLSPFSVQGGRNQATCLLIVGCCCAQHFPCSYLTCM